MNLQNKKEEKPVFSWDNPAHVKAIQQVISTDNVVLCSTDTVLGLLANITSKSHQELDRLKGRQDKPYLVLAGSIDRLKLFTDQIHTEKYVETLIAHFCPGPLTIIFAARPGLPSFMTHRGTIALRIPQHAGLQAVLSAFEGLFSTSANLTGQPVPATLAAVDLHIMAQVGGIIMDDRPPSSVPSTIVDVSGGSVKLVREGAISRAQLAAVVGRLT